MFQYSEQAIKIIELRKQGLGCRKIKKITGFSKSTISKWCNSLTENENIKNNIDKIKIKILTNKMITDKENNITRQISSKSKNNIRKLILRDSVKAWAIYKSGGKCCVCGYNRCMSSLTFHHIDQTMKIFNIRGMVLTYNLDKIIDELNKCSLMCHNCHTELHDGYNYKLLPIKIDHKDKPESVILWCVENKILNPDKYTTNRGQKYIDLNIKMP
jgi:hypothetical protein